MSDVVVVALIGAVPATLATLPGIALLRRTKTNHGKTIGQHVEELTEWAQFHQESDNELRRVLGLPDASFPLRPPEHTGLDTV